MGIQVLRGALALGVLAAAAAGQSLEIVDGTYGTGSAGTGVFAVVPGAASILVLKGQSADVCLPFVSFDPAPPSAPSIAGVALALDPATAVALAPPVVLGAAGLAELPLAVPPALAPGLVLHAQSLTVRGPGAELRLSEGLLLDVDDLRPETIVQGTFTGHPLGWSGGTLLIQSAAAWEAFWVDYAGKNPFLSPIPPPVDFAVDVVVAHFHGFVSHGGVGVEVTDFGGSAAAGLEVRVAVSTPDASCSVTHVVTQPHHIVRASRVLGVPIGAVAETVSVSPCN